MQQNSTYRNDRNCSISILKEVGASPDSNVDLVRPIAYMIKRAVMIEYLLELGFKSLFATNF